MTFSNREFRSVAVLGMGTMGAGIVHVLAASGRDVVALEADEARVEFGMDTLTRFLDDGVSRGKTTTAARTRVLARVRTTTTVAALAGVDLVIESVSEDIDVKRSVLAEVATVVDADTPICTNTSALSVTELAAALPNPQRVAGLHFFNPAPLMRTVEVISALQTSQELIERLEALVDSLHDKVAVVVKDRPGFLINALLLPYLNDVIAEYDDELATAEDIDVALQLGLGYKTGPLAMLDMIGLDVHLHATEAAHRATGDARYAPPPLLRQMVAAGQLGAKSGNGFRNSDTTTSKDS
jgi:3-hydroxybutyryl-CoA dehydrogenase